MRLLADKNVPLPSIRVLRQAGWDVDAVAEFAPGAPAPPGVIYLRLIPTGPEEAGHLLLDLLALQSLQLEGHFTVVERERIRQRPLLRTF
jgi:hypothetical protein